MYTYAFGLFICASTGFWLARQRFEYRYKVPAVVIACSAILASAVSVTTVLFLNSVESTFIAEGRLFANYIVLYGVAAVLWIVTMIKGKVLFNKEYWFFSLKLSFPLIGYSVAAQILNVSDRTMISKMVNDSAVGIYSTLYTVSSLSLMIWQAIHASFVPFLFKNIGQEKNDIKKISGWLIILYAFVAIIMTYLAPEIVKILAPEEYYNAIYIMPPIAAGVFLTCFTNIYSDIPVFYKKTKYVMYPAIIAAIMNLVLNYIFIGIFGYMAAAYTTLVSYIVWAILQAVWARKIASEYGIKNGCVYSDRLLILIASITISLCLFGLVLYQNTQMRYLVSSMVVLIGGCFSVYMRKKKIL
ncbi:MAG: polysaccharide biosynthesis C-terminal domain-containing protein [Clostridia bacterium]